MPPPSPPLPMELVDEMEGEGDTREEREGERVVEGERESFGEREGEAVVEGEREGRGSFEEVPVVEVLREELGDSEKEEEAVTAHRVGVICEVGVVAVLIEGVDHPVKEILPDTVPPTFPPPPPLALLGEEDRDNALL